MLLGYTGNFLASKYGVAYLFLYPEYLGKVGFASFALTGFALGGFIMAFNIYTYIIHAHRFPFLATLSKPFYKFSVNNFIIPASFTLYFIFQSCYFQYNAELESIGSIILNILGFLFGLFLFFFLSFFYFFRTNKTIEAYVKNSEEKLPKKTGVPSLRSKGNWYYNKAGKISWRVDSYLKNFSSLKLARNAKHYDKELLRKVFYQNHINATIFELLLIINFLLIGIFSDFELFILPGGASILLSFTFMLMIISVFLSWARGWTLTLLLLLGMGINFFSSSTYFNFINNALYGLDYDQEPAQYKESEINIIDHKLVSEDIQHDQARLDNWKSKVSSAQGEKPKLIIINCSGGGLRSALWTCQSLAYADSITNGKLLDHTVLMSGASGGMLGAAYVRELNYLEGENPWYNKSDEISTIGNDILNPLLLHLTTFDLFSGIRKFESNGHKYPKDRAYSFEQKLNINTHGILDKSLGDYYSPVNNAEMPMMILSPTIVSDGRRMLISSQPISYMISYEKGIGSPNNNENIEFNRFFKNHDAKNTKLSSALRANATFPYILPQVSLPTEPEVVIMDAGMRDNYGFKTSFQYIFSLQSWIEENTSGVVIISVRDKSKQIYKPINQSNSLFSRLTSPLGNLYNNFTRVHDFTHDQMIQELRSCIDQDIEEIYLEMAADRELDVSMSYHLTKKEKLIIKEGLQLKKNKQAFERIKYLLK
ncbi:MAG: hypothetical protein ACI8XB_000565 [Patiriisocius sp.]